MERDIKMTKCRKNALHFHSLVLCRSLVDISITSNVQTIDLVASACGIHFEHILRNALAQKRLEDSTKGRTTTILWAKHLNFQAIQC